MARCIWLGKSAELIFPDIREFTPKDAESCLIHHYRFGLHTLGYLAMP
jgi:hypothetical protein